MEIRKFRKATWVVINIKARRNQSPAHYVEAICQIPLLGYAKEYTRGKYIEITDAQSSNILEQDETPTIITLKFIKYERIDGGFYDRETKKDVEVQLAPSVYSNKVEEEAYFIPSVHKLVLKRSSRFPHSQLEELLMENLNRIENEGFDVDVVKDKASIEHILRAHQILSFKANISYSNPGNRNLFTGLLDEKLRDSNTRRMQVELQGSVDHPLQSGEDSLIDAVATISEENGHVIARVKEEGRTKTQVIDTREHPRYFELPAFENLQNFVAYIKNLFMN